jgi:hypothetical protein
MGRRRLWSDRIVIRRPLVSSNPMTTASCVLDHGGVGVGLTLVTRTTINRPQTLAS